VRRAQAPEFQRIAILRFENLGADPSADWLGRALSESVSAALEGAPGIYAIPSSRIHGFERIVGARPAAAPGISTERDLALLSAANRLGYGDYDIHGGTLEARLTMENPQTGKQTAAYTASAPAGQAPTVALALARRIWPGATLRLSANAGAMQAFVAALESSDPAAASQNLERALAADPDFAAAWRLLAQTEAQQQDRSGAAAAIERALARNLGPLARARLEVDAAEIRGDQIARLHALQTVSKLDPSDPVNWRALGDAAYRTHQYAQSAAAFQKSLDIEPDDSGALNQLGYARAWSGDLPAAENALRRYQFLRPHDANPLDSLGDVNLLRGRLKEAENYYLQAVAKVPHFEMDGSLFKAAMARLMTGDVAGAEELSRRYLAARAADHDPALEYRAAEWQWATGQRREACARMEAFARGAEAGPLRQLAARAYAELAVWKAELGDRPAAAQTARKAASVAGPSSEPIAAVALFLTQRPATAAEWDARALRAFPSGPNAVRELSLAYALLLDKEFEPASAILERIYASGQQADSEALPVLLAWTYIETGRVQEAASLLGPNPIPATSGTGLFLAFYFPRLYYLRSLSADHQGKREEAVSNYQLFRKLSGPDALLWDEERKVK
jgi:tetratricopeptide (TPR) repeat protein